VQRPRARDQAPSHDKGRGPAYEISAVAAVICPSSADQLAIGPIMTFGQDPLRGTFEIGVLVVFQGPHEGRKPRQSEAPLLMQAV